MNNKIIQYLNELVDFRDNEYSQHCEFNNFSNEDSEKYQEKTNNIKNLISEIEKSDIFANTELAEIKDKYYRCAADFDNYRKRIVRDSENTKLQANKDLISRILPVVDDFERVFSNEKLELSESVKSGFNLIYVNLTNILSSAGVSKITVNIGDQFDIHLHEAIST